MTNQKSALRKLVLDRHVEATICKGDMPYDPNDRTCGFEERHAIHDLYADESKRLPLAGTFLGEHQRHQYEPAGRGICAADEDDWPCVAVQLAEAVA